MSTRDYLTRLAGLAASTRFDALTPATVDAARAVTLDTLGAILAGSRLTANARLADLAAERSGSRTATLVGHRQKAEPMLAALANGTAGVSLEMDEGNRWGGGHPAIHVLPATLAVAEELAVDGRRFIEALVAGYEVTFRLGGASQVRPNVHSHGTWGTAGAAVAVARLRNHDVSAIRTVINLATSMSPANSWQPCFEGATIRNLYPGRSNMQAILAQLASRIEVSGDDTMSLRAGPERPTARVSVELGDGRVLTREAAIVRGDTANPRPRHELEAKFRALASDALHAARTNEVVETVARLEHLSDVRSLTALLTAAP